MKKLNPAYLAIWAGIPALAVVACMAGGAMMNGKNQIAFVALVCVAFALIVAIPLLLDHKLKTGSEALEKSFGSMGFSYQYKFTTNNAVYYIDQGGRMGVVWRGNPQELQFVDLNKLSDIRVNDGKMGWATSRVSCQFQLDGKKTRIDTLRVSRGTLSMKDKRVLEAISKADKLCELLKTAKSNATKG